MNKIVYYVASSLDGFICGPNGDISTFVPDGPGVEKYQNDLKAFKTVIMGKNTYEFGYQYGLPPGQPAYPHMQHHIFSRSIQLDAKADSVHIEAPELDRVEAIRQNAETDIYLCGGGMLAGWLLDHGHIDVLKLKLNPIILGDGIRLFGASKTKAEWDLVERESYDQGLQILTYTLRKNPK